MTADRDDYDGPWKDAVERYLPEFLAFFFPAACAAIDWTKGYAFLDQELQAVVQDAELGRRHVDKLVRVILTGGEETWILVHIEVQGSREAGFAERMFIYNTGCSTVTPTDGQLGGAGRRYSGLEAVVVRLRGPGLSAYPGVSDRQAA